jgi:hypothetical protein
MPQVLFLFELRFTLANRIGTLSKGGEITKIINNLLGLAIVGLVGGIVVAWISIGLDTLTFIVLSYIFRVCYIRSIPTSSHS